MSTAHLDIVAQSWYLLVVCWISAPLLSEALLFPAKAIADEARPDGNIILPLGEEESDELPQLGPRCTQELLEAVLTDNAGSLEEILTRDPSLQDCETSFSERALRAQVTGTALHRAADLGKNGIMNVLFKHGFDANAKTTEGGDMDWQTGCSPLMFAAYSGHLEAVQLLLKQSGIQVNARNSDGKSALILAAIAGWPEIVSELLRQPGIDVNQRNKDGQSALIVAARQQERQVTERLVQSKDIDVNLQDKEMMTALMYASSSNVRKAIVPLCTAPSLNVNLQRQDGRTALMLAANVGSTTAIDKLLTNCECHPSIDPNLVDEDENTAMMIAAAKGKLPALSQLNESKVEVDFAHQNKVGATILHIAVQGKQRRMVKKVIEISLDRLEQTQPLLYSASSAPKNTLKTNPSAFFDFVCAVSQAGYTALHLAAEMAGSTGASIVTEILTVSQNILQASPSDFYKFISKVSKAGDTALHLAVKNNGSTGASIVTEILRVSQNVLAESPSFFCKFISKASKAGDTALHLAVKKKGSIGDNIVAEILRVSQNVLNESPSDFYKFISKASEARETALHLAVQKKGSTGAGIVSELLKVSKEVLKDRPSTFFELVSTVSKAGETILQVAAKKPAGSGGSMILAEILRVCQEVFRPHPLLFFKLMNQVSEAGETVLHVAARKQGSAGILAKILSVSKEVLKNEPGLFFEFVNMVSEVGKETALQLAVKVGESDVVHMLLRNNATVEHRQDLDGHSALRHALANGYYIVTKLLLEHGAATSRDIGVDDSQGKRLALWMGVEFSLLPLLEYYARTEPDWQRMWQPPLNCNGDMEDRCQGLLLMRAKTVAVAHELLDWQVRVENQRHNQLDGSITTQEVNPNCLEASLAKGFTEIAFTLLARGVGEKIEDQRLDRLKLRFPMGFRLPSEGSAELSCNLIPVDQLKAWNRLHWGAYACDASALNLALEYPSNTLVDYLDSCPGEGRCQTPFALAEQRKSDCVRSFLVLEVLQATWRSQHLCRTIKADLLVAVCLGTLGLHLFFLQLRTLQKHGWISMSAAPSVICATGAVLVFAKPKSIQGQVTTETVQLSIGWAALVGGALLFLGVFLVFLSNGMVDWLQGLKKRGNEKLDRCWETANCGLGCLLAFALFVETGLRLQMGLALDVLQLFTGIAHAVTVTVPLLVATPRWVVMLLRLSPGFSVAVFLIVSCLQSRDLSPPSSEGTLLVATCLALAWTDVAGTAAQAVQRVSSLIEIELSTKQDTRLQAEGKFTANKLVLGHAASAAHGIESTLGLTTQQVSEGLKDPIEAMRKEVLATGDEDDIENFRYIVEGTSGRATDLPKAVATSLETGIYHGGSIGPDDFDTGHDERTLDDWMHVEEVVLAQLTKGEFVAVRFYTSSSFRKINGPLRREERPHPWAMVVFLLDRGIKKLRSVQAQVNPQAFAGETVLWRGMKNLKVDVREFADLGGTEMAPMSTTTNEEVARHYAASKVPLVFKFVVGGLKTGVSIRFLSLYPKEEEFLYAPLTYLSLKKHYEDDGTKILVVEPVMS